MNRGAQKKGRSGAGKRRRAREMAIQMLYQQEQGGSRLQQVFDTFDLEDYLEQTESEKTEDADVARNRAKESFEHACRLVEGTVGESDRIDDLIRRHAENWRLERMPAIDRNILRLAVYEMLHEDGVPKVVIVDEAIELAKRFGAESSGRFVNGLLDGVMKAAGHQRPKNEHRRKERGKNGGRNGGRSGGGNVDRTGAGRTGAGPSGAEAQKQARRQSEQGGSQD